MLGKKDRKNLLYTTKLNWFTIYLQVEIHLQMKMSLSFMKPMFSTNIFL